MRVVLATLFSVVTLLAVLQIISRYLGWQMSWTSEAMRFLFIWFVMIGSAYALREKKHIVVDFISDSLSARVVKWIDIAMYLVIGIFTLVLIKYGFEVAEVTRNQSSPIMRIPMSYAFLSIPLGGVLMLLYGILNIVDLIRGKETNT